MISLRCCYNNLQQFNDMQDSLEKQTEKSKTYWSIPFIYNSSVKAGVNPKTYRERINTGKHQR